MEKLEISKLANVNVHPVKHLIGLKKYVEIKKDPVGK
jgi:hypothetical protein